ncbi:DNA replication and repair protein RecF [Candidatus Hepatincolaceae symbiont of Richtersius coronifer]
MLHTYCIQSLQLSNFRNYQDFFADFSQGSYVLYGPNGLGKTNILEAISILSPGKGLRGEPLKNLITTNQSSSAVIANIKNNLGIINLKTLIEPTEENDGYKKRYLMDEQSLKSNNMLDYYLNCLWLIPQMDNFFLQDNLIKRKLIDKMVFFLDKHHATRLNEHDKLLKERNKILSLQQINAPWLSIIEGKLSELSVTLVASRLDLLNQLNPFLVQNTIHPIQLSLQGTVEELFAEYTYALKVENIMKEKFLQARATDAMQHSYSWLQKSRLLTINLFNKQLAENCSTGEQKMMLISIIIAFAEVLLFHKNLKPILLLDEINVHLDQRNTCYIIDKLLQLKTQLFITTTNENIYGDFQKSLNFYKVGN